MILIIKGFYSKQRKCRKVTDNELAKNNISEGSVIVLISTYGVESLAANDRNLETTSHFMRRSENGQST